MPPNAIIDDAEGRAGLLGALVQRYVDAGTPITHADILRPRERGFLAAVLTPGTRAVSVAVDPVSGVSGLIWPGDRVDVILTQEFERNAANPARRVISETVLTNVRVIAVDQSIAQGASYTAGAAGKLASTVTLQATTDQAERLAVARRLGALTLAIRAMGDTLVVGDQSPPVDRPPVSGEDVSPGLLHANGAGGSRVQVIQGDQHSEVTFR
jgi:pilus assembly protein CpaB